MNNFFENLSNYFGEFFTTNSNTKPKKKRGRPCKYFKDIEYGYNPVLPYLINKKLNLIETVYPL